MQSADEFAYLPIYLIEHVPSVAHTCLTVEGVNIMTAETEDDLDRQGRSERKKIGGKEIFTWPRIVYFF